MSSRMHVFFIAGAGLSGCQVNALVGIAFALAVALILMVPTK